VTRDEPDGRSGASWDDTLSASPHIGCWRFSDAGDGDYGVGGKAGEQAREETVGEQVGPFGLGADSDELSDDVEDGARRQCKKDDADRLAGEAVPDGGADEGGTAADQAEGGKERPAGPGCVRVGVGGQGRSYVVGAVASTWLSRRNRATRAWLRGLGALVVQ